MSQDPPNIEAIDRQILRRYEVLTKIGKGSYGVVWRAMDKQTQQLVALKKVFSAFQNATDSQRTYREITFLRALRKAPFVIQLLACHRAENDADIYLVFECLETDLHNVIRIGILKDVHRQFIFWQLCCALKYLHSANVVHRDIKPGNLLINADSSIKLCDFGLARVVNSDCESEELTDYIATRWYRSPEILFGSLKYSFSVDMWAAGCILAELISGRPLFPGSNTMDQLERIISFTGQLSDDDISSMESSYTRTMLQNLSYSRPKFHLEEKLPNAVPEAIDIIKKLLVFNPNKRLSAAECLEHPFLAQFHKPERESVAPEPVQMSIKDSEKHSIRDYRQQVYKEAVTSPDCSRAGRIHKI